MQKTGQAYGISIYREGICIKTTAKINWYRIAAPIHYENNSKYVVPVVNPIVPSKQAPKPNNIALDLCGETLLISSDKIC